MELIADGKEQAFSELYERYADRLVNYFFRMLRKDREKAEDFMQELFTKIITKPELYQTGRNVQTYLFSIANNMCKNDYRSHEVRQRAAEELKHTQNHYEPEQASQNIDKNAFDDALEQALRDLDETKRSTFEMRYRDELSIKEIAEVFECSEGTVKSRLFYTLKHLNQSLKAFEGSLITLVYLLFQIIEP